MAKNKCRFCVHKNHGCPLHDEDTDFSVPEFMGESRIYESIKGNVSSCDAYRNVIYLLHLIRPVKTSIAFLSKMGMIITAILAIGYALPLPMDFAALVYAALCAASWSLWRWVDYE